MEKEEIQKEIETLRNNISIAKLKGFNEDYINIFYVMELRRLKGLLKEAN